MSAQPTGTTGINTTSIEFYRPKMYAKQEAAIFDPARYSVIEASTKSGKTVGCMAWILEQAYRSKWHNHWWIAPTRKVGTIAFRRFKTNLTRGAFHANNSELTITLQNGHTLWFHGSDRPDLLYGEDVGSVVMDEASRIKEEARHAAESILTATMGPMRVIGNVKGKRNWFYRMARRAQQGEKHMAYHRLTWEDAVAAGVLKLEAIEDARRQLPETVFEELYGAVATDDGANPFGVSAIMACLLEMPDTHPVAWGWDLGKMEDYTVGVALDSEGRVCRFHRWRGEDWGRTIQRIQAATGATEALIDSTGLGDPVLDVARAGGANLQGYKFTSQSKQQLMEGLAVAIQRQEIRFPDGPIKDELLEFTYEPHRLGVRYTAPEGLHDDCVCALALAWQCKQRYHVPIAEIGSIVGERSPWDA